MRDDDLLYIEDSTVRGYVIPLRDPKEKLVTDERKSKGDMVGERRHVQAEPNTILHYLLHTRKLTDDHKYAAQSYMDWRTFYEFRNGYRGNKTPGEGNGDSFAADRYVKLIMILPRLKLDLVNHACYLTASIAARNHARDFHHSYTAAFDALINVVDTVRDMDLN